MQFQKYARNPWHCVYHNFLEENTVNAIIEIPRGCKAKYELDKESGAKQRKERRGSAPLGQFSADIESADSAGWQMPS